MKYAKIDVRDPDPVIVRQAVATLRKGGIVVYPTDTLYGLGIDVTNPDAVRKLFALKGRPANQPVSLMADSLEAVEGFNSLFPVSVHRKLMQLLPGPFTVLLENQVKPEIKLYPQLRTLPKIGWRVPDNRFCQELSTMFGYPISTTSANLSGKSNVKDVREVIAAFGDKLDLVLDGGPVGQTKGSTIVDFTKSPLMVVREGDVSLRAVRERLADNRIRLKQDKFHIVFVCSGNICRSPMAEGILKAMLQKTRYRHLVEVQSAGTLTLPPSPAHELALKVSAANEIDIRRHVSRHITQAIIDRSALIVALAVNHVDYLKRKFPDDKDKVILLRQWHRGKMLSNPSVADPIGHNTDFFSDTYTEIYSELKRVLPFIFVKIKKFAAYNDLPLSQ